MTETFGMRQIARFIMIFGALLASTSFADAPSREAELTALSDAWIAAEVGHDKVSLEQILDSRFQATFTSGKTIDRTAYVDWIMKTEIAPFEVLTERVELHGDTAVVIATTVDRKTKFTWIAVRRGGRWRVISETFSKITGPT